MADWLLAVAIAAGIMVTSWVVLVVAARRLPPGVLRDLAGFIPACVTAARRLRRDPGCPAGPRSPWRSPGCGCCRPWISSPSSCR